MEFERLRREGSARTIQRNWRHHREGGGEAANLLAQMAGRVGAGGGGRWDARRFPHKFQLKPGKGALHGQGRGSGRGRQGRAEGVGEAKYGSVPQSWAEEEEALAQQRQRLLVYMGERLDAALEEEEEEDVDGEGCASAPKTPGDGEPGTQCSVYTSTIAFGTCIVLYFIILRAFALGYAVGYAAHCE